MTITLSWDLFVIVFFAIVLTYSFIIGKHESVKIIVATYIATVAVQGLGNALTKIMGDAQDLSLIMDVTIDTTVMAMIKLGVFVAAIIFIAARSGIEIEYGKDSGSMMSLVFTGLFGFATAGLLMSTLLTFLAGTPLLDSTLPEDESMALIVEQSDLMELMIVHQDLWFALPAILLLVAGVLGHGEDGDS